MAFQRDPLSASFDPWSRALLEVLKADRWNWHARMVHGPAGPVDAGGLSRHERAVQRSLWWCLWHTESTGVNIRWSCEYALQVTWGPPRRQFLIFGERRRQLNARVAPADAARRAVKIMRREEYVGRPTSRGANPGEGWQPKQMR